MIPISPTIAIDEMVGIQKIVEKWIERVKEGIPTLNFEARDEDFELFMKQWVGELRILSGIGDNLADVLSGVR